MRLLAQTLGFIKMKIFNKVEEWRFNPTNGNVEFRLCSDDGNTYEASFKREIVPDMIVHLHRLFGTTIEQFPEGASQLLQAYAPQSMKPVLLEGGHAALHITSVEGIGTLLPLGEEGLSDMISELQKVQNELYSKLPPGSKPS